MLVVGLWCKITIDNTLEGTVMGFHAYTVSLHYDQRLYKQDITGSISHARMLAKQGIISSKDADAIHRGLAVIQEEIENGTFPWKDELEDVHMNIEARLFEVIGETAGRLHTARSRNDQVAVDVRLYTKEALHQIQQGAPLPVQKSTQKYRCLLILRFPDTEHLVHPLQSMHSYCRPPARLQDQPTALRSHSRIRTSSTCSSTSE